MKNLILALLFLTILSGCGVRKVQTNKSTTEIKETSLQAIKIDSTATNVVKVDESIKEVDTSKTTELEKVVIEYFNADGSLSQRVTTSNTKLIQNAIYKAKTFTKVDSVKLSVLKDLKDSSVVSVKKVEKVKHIEAKRYNMLLFGIVLCVGVAMYLYVQRKYRQ